MKTYSTPDSEGVSKLRRRIKEIWEQQGREPEVYVMSKPMHDWMEKELHKPARPLQEKE